MNQIRKPMILISNIKPSKFQVKSDHRSTLSGLGKKVYSVSHLSPPNRYLFPNVSIVIITDDVYTLSYMGQIRVNRREVVVDTW